MGATTSLSSNAIAVDPGRDQSVELQVRNNGTVVDAFELTILGEAAAWSAAEPPSLNLFPGTEGTARIHFRPPRSSSVPAGTLPWGVRVASREDPDGSSVEEGTVEVLPFLERTAELVPRSSHGRRRARYELAVDNRGNTLLNSDLAVIEPDGHLRYRFDPAAAVVRPGEAEFLALTTIARKPFWRGTPKTRPFKVQVGTADETISPTLVDGIMVQDPRLPRWLFRVLAALLALALILVLLWFTLVKPTIHDEAKNAAQQAASGAQQQAAAAAQHAAAAQQAAAAAQKAAGGGGAGATTPGATTATTVTPGPLTTPTGGRLAFTVPSGSTVNESLSGLSPNHSFQLTDVVFENPNGDGGTISVVRASSTVLFENLSNFRSLDYHFVSPISFPAGSAVTVRVSCNNPTGQACTPGAYVGGFSG